MVYIYIYIYIYITYSALRQGGGFGLKDSVSIQSQELTISGLGLRPIRLGLHDGRRLFG